MTLVYGELDRHSKTKKELKIMISTTFATKTYKNFINNEWVNASSGNNRKH
jgi:aldehyde dehydrogenase (NAD+)